jgi:hypothetical protein
LRIKICAIEILALLYGMYKNFSVILNHHITQTMKIINADYVIQMRKFFHCGVN